MKSVTMFFWMSLMFCLTLGFATPATAKPVVFVTIAPQKYFVEQIAGDLVDVKVLVSPGANPHVYEPTPSQMLALAKAKAYFAIGINLETVWLPRINSTAPSLRIVYTQHGVKKIPMAAHAHHEEEHEEHSHDSTHDTAREEHADEEHHHDHGTLDPHIWLDPIRVRTIADNTCKGLVKADPENRETYETNLATFLADIDKMHKTITRVMDNVPAKHRSFMVFHPSWGYFAERYDLTQLPIEIEGREPSPRDLAEIVEHARNDGIKVIFVQPQISRKTADVIAREIDAKVKQLDPLAEDWKQNLVEAARAFESTLR